MPIPRMGCLMLAKGKNSNATDDMSDQPIREAPSAAQPNVAPSGSIAGRMHLQSDVAEARTAKIVTSSG